jgi:hypothetical protein
MKIPLYLITWMNILHLVSSKKEESPSIQKLKATCKDTATCPVSFPKEDLQDRLTPIQYKVTQEKGTERFLFNLFFKMKFNVFYHAFIHFIGSTSSMFWRKDVLMANAVA